MSEDLLQDKQSARALSLFLLLLVGIAIVFLGVFAVGYYAFGWSDAVTQRVVLGVRYPGAMVEGTVISVKSFEDDAATLENYYAQQAEANPQLGEVPAAGEIRVTAMNRALRDAMTIRLARARGISISDGDVAEEYQRMVDQSGGDEAYVKDTVATLYNWTPEQFQEKVITPYLYRAAMVEAVAKDDTLQANIDAKQRAEDVLAQVQAGEKSFEDLAQEFSEDSTASVGGDLGVFGKGEMVAEFEQAAFALKDGEASGIVRTQFGFHIIKVDQHFAANEEDGTPEQVSAHHILIRTQDFDDYLTDHLKAGRVYVFVPDLAWNGETGAAELAV
jgi:hypothetical protein